MNAWGWKAGHGRPSMARFLAELPSSFSQTKGIILIIPNNSAAEQKASLWGKAGFCVPFTYGTYGLPCGLPGFPSQNPDWGYQS